ncbi:GGDEF domain-containing protein [Microaerobacter geothermalis]|uniref:GGDEF domain-containing protein n=1 Tax=Microaerobacter geothermalis TaxID=674972 RepID=UPI001F1C3C83|nr:GGDEF domain-containing protein [Microaerobacter geothermalis]MCF6094709.1 GGDEF domain-containing protein [Microaerobacter geothermalis]
MEGILLSIQLIFILLATGASFYLYRKKRDRYFLFGSLALLSLTIGESIFNLLKNQNEHIVYHSSADFFYLLFYLFLFLLVFQRRKNWFFAEKRFHKLLDASIIFIVAFSSVWYFVIGPVIFFSPNEISRNLLNFSYPILDLILMFYFYLFWLGDKKEFYSYSTILIGISFVFGLIADSMFVLSTNSLIQGKLIITLANVISRLSLVFAILLKRPDRRGSYEGIHWEGLIKNKDETVYNTYPYLAIFVWSLIYLVSRYRAGDEGWEKNLIDLGVFLILLIAFRQFLYLRENKKLMTSLEFTAVTDPLTGAFNRNCLVRLQESFEEKGRPCSAIFVDLDYFKEFNDQYGHIAGDERLIHTVQLIKNGIRETDLLIRFGGDEFLVILPNTRYDQAKRIEERIKQQIERYNFLQAGVSPLKVTFGIYSDDFGNLRKVIEKADLMMYQGKPRARQESQKKNVNLEKKRHE